MPRKRSEAPPINATERRFLEALERLKEKKPMTPELKKQATLNRLRINFSSVAQEAGLSRTLIGHEGCKYPRVRAAVTEAMKPVAQPRTAAEVITNKREEAALLREALRVRDSVNAALVLRLSQVEKEADRMIRRAGREAENAVADANRIAGRRLSPGGSRSLGTVVPLRSEDSDDVARSHQPPPREALMPKRDVEADILGRLNRFIEDGGTIPPTPDGKVNVLALCRALGLPATDAQHFHRKEAIKTAVSAIGAEQGLAPIGARGAPDPQEEVLEERLREVRGKARIDAMAATEALAAMQAMVEELRAARAEILALQAENRTLMERLRLIEEQGILWDAGAIT